MTVKVREIFFLAMFLAAFCLSLYVESYVKAETTAGKVFYYLARDFYQLLMPVLAWLSAGAMPSGTKFSEPRIQRIFAVLIGLLAIAALTVDLYGVFRH